MEPESIQLLRFPVSFRPTENSKWHVIRPITCTGESIVILPMTMNSWLPVTIRGWLIDIKDKRQRLQMNTCSSPTGSFNTADQSPPLHIPQGAELPLGNVQQWGDWSAVPMLLGGLANVFIQTHWSPLIIITGKNLLDLFSFVGLVL